MNVSTKSFINTKKMFTWRQGKCWLSNNGIDILVLVHDVMELANNFFSCFKVISNLQQHSDGA